MRSWSWKLRGIISKVCPGWTTEIFTQEQSLFSDPAFLKLSHIEFYRLSWNHIIILAKAGEEAKQKLYISRGDVFCFFFFPCSARGSCVLWFDQTPSLPEPPACYEQAAAVVDSQGCCLDESSKVVRLNFGEETVKELSVPLCPGGSLCV